jgi:mutator protein MutT
MKITAQRMAVYGFIVNSRRELLVVQRAKHDTMPGIWELPGGKLEMGEAVTTGVRREVAEESGLAVVVHSPLALISSVSGEVQVIRVAYHCTLSDEHQPVVLSDEHSEYRWVTRAGIETLPSLSQFLRALLSEERASALI